MRRPLFLRYFLSYLAVVVLTVLIGSLVYIEARRVVKEEVIASGRQSLAKGRDLIDARFEEIDRLIAYLADDGEIRDFLNNENPLPTRAYFRILKVAERLTDYNSVAGFIRNIFVYFLNPDVVQKVWW